MRTPAALVAAQRYASVRERYPRRVGVSLAVLFTLFGWPLLAADPIQKVEAQCRIMLERNFNAVNAEDLRQLMKTFTKEAASGQHAADFKEEAAKMFSDTDVYMRLVDFKLIDLRPPMAEALVLQLTLPADEKDREPVRHQRLGVNFKHHSALLPEFELVKYRQRFRYENGEWKVHQIVSRPLPASTKTIEDAGLRPASRK